MILTPCRSAYYKHIVGVKNDIKWYKEQNDKLSMRRLKQPLIHLHNLSIKFKLGLYEGKNNSSIAEATKNDKKIVS